MYNVAPTTRTWDSKAGTIIHETSHFDDVLKNRDYVYGKTGAQSLAETDPYYA